METLNVPGMGYSNVRMVAVLFDRLVSARRVSHALEEQFSIFYCLIARGQLGSFDAR
jgi:hypothetical protein